MIVLPGGTDQVWYWCRTRVESAVQRVTDLAACVFVLALTVGFLGTAVYGLAILGRGAWRLLWWLW